MISEICQAPADNLPGPHAWQNHRSRLKYNFRVKEVFGDLVEIIQLDLHIIN